MTDASGQALGGIRRWAGRYGAAYPHKAGRDQIDGIVRLSDGRTVLRVRVAAAPSGGEANSALARLLAQTLRVAPRDITLVGGATSRIKRMLIKGDARAAVTALEEIGEVAAR